MCKAKRGQRPRVQSTPIDDTWLTNLKNWSIKWRFRTLLPPESKQTFVIHIIKPETSSQMSTSVNTFSMFRECFVIHSFLVKILYNIFLTTTNATQRQMH